MAGLGPIPGFMNSPIGQIASLIFGPILGAFENNRQNEEQRQLSEDQFRFLTGLAQQQGGLRPYDDPAGNLFGVPGQLPYDEMGGANRLETLGANRMAMDRQMATDRFNDFSKWLNEATQGRENRLLGEFDKGAGEVQGYAEKCRDAVMDLLGRGLGDVQSRLGSRSQEALSGYANAFQDSYSQLQDRYRRGMANLEGMGEQARRDINERYDAQAGSIQQDLASRGLGNSTVLASMRMGNERERGGELGRLAESIRAQRLATDAALSGDVAAAKAADALNWSGLISNLRGDEANAAMSGTQLLGNAYGNLTGDVLNTMGNLFGNRMNLSSLLSGQTLGTAGGLREGGMNQQNQFDAQLSDWLINSQINKNNIGGAANANMMNIVGGTNITFPDNTWLSVASNLGQGLGGANAFNWYADFVNQQSRPETIFTNALMGGLGGGLTAPFSLGLGGGAYNATLGRVPGGFFPKFTFGG